eukprot:maker-scaffold75_size407189-snap-gene-1.14 protein:Tk10124 transcript:maker-scaffold75_size407189-snap-gene-1.14-mRNA-1 annotation:"GI16319"
MSTGCGKTRNFFESGTLAQFEYVLTLYDKCLKVKAEAKSQKPENIIKLDKWYQNELPKKIKSRGKDPHLIHDELVQTIKWKLSRGKFRPNLTNLIQMNTPRVVMQETKKAFRQIKKKQDLQAGVTALCNLKGVGPAMASAVLAAGAPDMAPFMADEVLLALPDVDSLDYTMKEYNRLVDHVNQCLERLTKQGATNWNPHKVELAVWTYYIANDLKPELLDDLPSSKAGPVTPVEKEEEAPAPVTNGTTLPEEALENDDSSEANPPAEFAKEDNLDEETSADSEENGSSSPPPKPSEPEQTKANGNGSMENGNKDSNGSASATNGDATPSPQENGSSKAASEPTVSQNSPKESDKEIMDQSEENTNDSTKENKEAAVKRPPPTEVTGDNNGESEPVSKKLKVADGADPAQPDLDSQVTASQTAPSPQQQQGTPLTTA